MPSSMSSVLSTSSATTSTSTASSFSHNNMSVPGILSEGCSLRRFQDDAGQASISPDRRIAPIRLRGSPNDRRVVTPSSPSPLSSPSHSTSSVIGNTTNTPISAAFPYIYNNTSSHTAEQPTTSPVKRRNPVATLAFRRKESLPQLPLSRFTQQQSHQHQEQQNCQITQQPLNVLTRAYIQQRRIASPEDADTFTSLSVNPSI
ncbi:unnamed protein product [Protopolystoma xenopodis]|uniref:Uncharacterized protein n=1 Tax=Protopolystoma xenopodis TaxID=117903 RepID=A0A3S5BG23_9PLAT|nr:unnamed protein product [Protopolystoma xenopodis]